MLSLTSPRHTSTFYRNRPEWANTGRLSATQHAESDRPGATLQPLTWRFLIGEMAVSSDNVCAIVYAAISSISIPAQRARRAAYASPW